MSTQINISKPIQLEVNTTPITSGTVGRLLFQGTGNVLQQSANISWDNTNVAFFLGSVATRTLIFRPQATSGAFGNSSLIAGGNGNGRLDFYSATNITQLTDNVVVLTSVGGPSIQVGVSSIVLNVAGATQLAVAATTGNIVIGGGADAGFKMDVNGTARMQGRTDITPTIATTNHLLKLSDNTHGTARMGFSSSANIGFFIGSNNAVTIGKVSLDNSNPLTNAAQIVLNKNGNPSLELFTYSTNVGIAFSDQNNGTIRMNFPSSSETAITTISSHNFSIGVASGVGSLTSTTMKFFQSTGNVGINTTTDAGYRLDVNGTARFTDSIFFPANSIAIKIIGGANILQIVSNDGLKINGFLQITSTLTLSNGILGGLGGNNAGNTYNFQSGVSGAVGLRNIFNFNALTSTQSGGLIRVINLEPTYTNQNVAQTFKGIYYNPNTTGLVSGTPHHAFHSTSGRVRLEGLPTSSAGLSAGDIWNDNGTLKIV
jgi:hypothetical protein